MTTERTKRKLSTILSADVKGYSVLMADDEVATVKTLTAYRDLISSLTRKHQGRVVDSPGDNILVVRQCGGCGAVRRGDPGGA